jgi:hypothetical protein
LLTLLDILTVAHPGDDVFFQQLRRVESATALFLPPPSKCSKVVTSSAMRCWLAECSRIAINGCIHRWFLPRSAKAKLETLVPLSARIKIAWGRAKSNILSVVKRYMFFAILPIRMKSGNVAN